MTEQDLDLTFGDYCRVLKRRMPSLVAIIGTVLLIGVAIAYRVSPTYEATGVLLAQRPEVPDYVVRSTVPDYPEESVRIVTQRVLTSENLERIVAAHDLYPELRSSPRAALRELQDNVRLSAEDPELLENILGTSRAATAMAFSISFSSPSPILARDVAGDLVSLYVDENQRARRQQAAGTASFLTAEAQRIAEEIAEREAQLAEFKRTNAGTLPEQRNVNLQQLDRLERDLETTDQEIRSLREEQALYVSELRQLSPRAALVDERGETVLGSEDRLRILQRRYVQLSATYSQDHPDVAALRREIAALEHNGGIQAVDRSALRAELAARLDELAAARDRYSNGHPDVVRLERTVQSLRNAVASAPGDSFGSLAGSPPDNPVYIQRQVQLQGTSTDLDAAIARRDEIRARLGDLEDRLSGGPGVEREYSALTRGYQQMLAQYDDIQVKLRDSELALNLETNSKGKQFTLLQSPITPTSPSRPNRLAVLLLALVTAVVLGAAGVAIIERADSAVRAPKDVMKYLGIPPLVAIPFVSNNADSRRRGRQRLFAAAAVCAWTGLVVFLVVTPAG